MYYIYRTSTAIGDYMIAAFFVRMLNDNGIQAFYSSKPYFEVVDVPKTLETERDKMFMVDYPSYKHSFMSDEDPSRTTIIEHMLNKFRGRFGITKDIEIKTTHVPINYVEIPEIQGVDVVMNTKSGHWSPYRDWPYFQKLKTELDKFGIRYIDLNQEGIMDQKCLNLVKKSRLYLGLETGTSHFVSQVVNDSLIIQSGYTHNRFWNFYGYDYISHNVSCQCCYLSVRSKSRCPRNNECMRMISVDSVLGKIKEKLSVNKKAEKY